MRAHFFQHAAFEGLGSIVPWLEARQVEVSTTRFFEKDELPNAADIDFLIVMGGPMSVNDERDYPWLVPEKRFIGDMINRGQAVLGVCLGSQLIASVLGSNVYPNSEREIGWFPVQSTSSKAHGPVFQFPAECLAFHWHGETFDLPVGAVHLAKSVGCRNQAFQLGANVMGLQFHLETTPLAAREIVMHCREEIVPARYVQSADVILGAPPERYAKINALMSEVLSFVMPDDG
jgi:GMP synthase-like glutamine amidotransferase